MLSSAVYNSETITGISTTHTDWAVIKIVQLGFGSLRSSNQVFAKATQWKSQVYCLEINPTVLLSGLSNVFLKLLGIKTIKTLQN
ncbi:hypothetical protein ABEB36_012341 [Hypothenemus hampei]|uniref:Uncharacterized protein n=1 Tax=Hypothenemus hampei TaxID=57062 RepID=A0ABD1EAY9_HYPHA